MLRRRVGLLLVVLLSVVGLLAGCGSQTQTVTSVVPARGSSSGAVHLGRVINPGGGAGSVSLATLEEHLTLPVEKAKTVTTSTVTLNLAEASVFVLTIEHATEVKLEHAPTFPTEVQVYFKENGTGGFAVTFHGIKWIGTEPTFSTLANTENLVTLNVRGGNAAEPYGVAGAEGKEGPKGSTGSTGPEGKVPNTIIPQSFLLSGVVKTGEVFPGFYEKNASGETTKIVGVEYSIQSGTSCEVKIYKATKGGETGTAIKWSGSTEKLKPEKTPAEKTPEATTEVKPKEYVYAEVTAESGTPTGVTVTLFVEHVG
jgi:hypothetical protein